MENKNEFELIVSEGKRPIWSSVLAALFFTLMFYSIYLLFQLIWEIGFSARTLKNLPSFFKTIALSLAGGITFSVTKTILIDVDKDKLISRFFVGPFSKDVLSVIPELEYVSIFLNSKDDYEVNLWYNKNKHYKMYSFDEKCSAFNFGSEVAKKLKLDLLDATEKGNPKWIE